jgi:hypothetical protein
VLDPLLQLDQLDVELAEQLVVFFRFSFEPFALSSLSFAMPPLSFGLSFAGARCAHFHLRAILPGKSHGQPTLPLD